MQIVTVKGLIREDQRLKIHEMQGKQQQQQQQ
jgi:hypothetical protein